MTIFRTLLYIGFCIFFTSSLFAQDTLKLPTSKRVVISPGATFQKVWTGNVTIMYADYNMGPCNYAVAGPFIGSEIVVNGSNIIYAPKVGYQLAGMLICLRGSELNYIHNKSVDVRLLPEVGLDFATGLNLCYGYNFHVFGDKLNDVSNHRISLMFNIYFDPRKRKK
jgi:hypothetical protein